MNNWKGGKNVSNLDNSQQNEENVVLQQVVVPPGPGCRILTESFTLNEDFIWKKESNNKKD